MIYAPNWFSELAYFEFVNENVLTAANIFREIHYWVIWSLTIDLVKWIC